MDLQPDMQTVAWYPSYIQLFKFFYWQIKFDEAWQKGWSKISIRNEQSSQIKGS